MASGPYEIRPYTSDDRSAVLRLIDQDRLPGQPAVTADMLAHALAGHSDVDDGWWGELETPVTEVACDPSGQVAGVVSSALRRKDGVGLVLWLHCGEVEPVARQLLDHVLVRFAKRGVHAFDFSSALTLGLEALPTRHRPVTVRVLKEAGFAGEDLWRYMHAHLPLPDLPHADAFTVSESTDPPGRRLEVRDGDELLAEALVGLPYAGIGVLWWISVEPPARQRGLGLALLGSALDLLAGLGAREAILYVDDDAPAGDARDRTAANRLYDRAGFTEVDRLHSFSRPARNS